MSNIIKQLQDADGNNIFPLAYAQGGVKMDLLWTNPSVENDSATFNAQTVSVNTAGYDYYILFTCLDNAVLYSSRDKMTIIAFKGARMLITGERYADTITGKRTFTITDSGITFTDAKYSSTTANSWCVPICLFGIKTSWVVPTSVQGLQYVEV